MNKEEFLHFVSQCIRSNPTWAVETTTVVEGALAAALLKEQMDKAAVCYAMALFVDEAPQVVKDNKESLRNGLKILARFFKGAPCEGRLKELVQ